MIRSILPELLILLSLTGCSSLGKNDADAKKNANTIDYMPYMVISNEDFQQDSARTCTHSKQCTAPLICEDSHCVVPPGITGKRTESTPSLSFTTSKGEQKIWLEVVNDEYTMARGLMMRRTMQPDWGMLFVYPDEGKRAFWMMNTYIPLDMIFIHADGSVSNFAQNAEPLNTTPRYLSTSPVKYVLELTAGSVNRYGITESTKISFDLK